MAFKSQDASGIVFSSKFGVASIDKIIATIVHIYSYNYSHSS